MVGLVDCHCTIGGSTVVIKGTSVIRYLFLPVLVLLLVACVGDPGVAPVDDRSIKNRSASSSNWYTVRKGDTLFSIAFANGRDYRSVARINRIKAPYTIYPGQRIRLVERRKVIKKTTKKKKSTSTSSKSVSSSKNVVKKKPAASSKIYWGWPTKGKIIRNYSSSAPRKKGIGIGGKPGQAVAAAANGKVVYSGDGLLGYGNLIIIKHNEHFLSAYAHNNKVYVKEGQAVKRGEKIATMGENENNRPMLHFEIRKNGKPVNPGYYLPKG